LRLEESFGDSSFGKRKDTMCRLSKAVIL